MASSTKKRSSCRKANQALACPAPSSGVIGQLPEGAAQGLMQQVEIDDHHQASHQDSQGEFPAAPEVSGHDQHRHDRPVGDFQVAG